MTFELTATLVIVAVTIVMFISGKVDFGIICIFDMVCVTLTGVMSAEEALASFANVNVVLCAAMFVIGMGLTRTGIIQRITSLLKKYQDKPGKLIAIACIAGALISALVSPVIAVPVMIPILAELANETGISRSRLLYPMAASVNAAAGVTIMGMGAFNAVSNNLMMEAGAAIPLRMIDFTIARTPFVVITILYMVFIGYKLLPSIPNDTFEDYNFGSAEEEQSIGKTRQRLASVISVVIIVCLLISDFINIPAWVIASVGACLYVVTGTLKPQEAYQSIHMPTVFLFAGILTLTAAMTASGADQFVGKLLISFLGGQTNPYFILFIVMLTVLIMTQFMSNMIIVVFSGIAAMVFVQLGLDPRAAVMGIQICGSASILTPMASPVQAMVMAPGKYTLKDFLKSGLPLCAISLVVAVFFLPMLFPFQ